MSMKLALAIALECLPTECKVQFLESDTPVTVHYSARVQARIKIHPGQLVALDTTPAIPEIVYRWHYARVAELRGDKVVVITDHQGQLVELVKAERLEIAPQVGDWVFVTLGGNVAESEVFDIAIDGRPTHPVQLASYVLPKVEQFYQKMRGA